MNLAKNAMQDLAGKAEKAAGAVTDNDGLKEDGQQKREEAVGKEVEEEIEEGREPEALDEHSSPEKFGKPDFDEDSTVSVDDVTTPEGHSR